MSNIPQKRSSSWIEQLKGQSKYRPEGGKTSAKGILYNLETQMLFLLLLYELYLVNDLLSIYTAISHNSQLLYSVLIRKWYLYFCYIPKPKYVVIVLLPLELEPNEILSI